MCDRTTCLAVVTGDSTGHWIERALGNNSEVVVSVSDDAGQILRLIDTVSANVALIEFPADSGWLVRRQELARAVASAKPSLPIIALGENDSQSLLLSALRVGVSDFVVSTSDDEELLQVVLGVQNRVSTYRYEPAGRKTVQISLLGGRPDGDAALFALHLAIGVQEKSTDGRPVLLLDIGFPANDVLTILGLKAEYGLADAIHNAGAMDQILVDTAFQKHASGLRVLGVGDDLTCLSEFRSSDVLMFMDSLGHYFSQIVINLAGVTDVGFVRAFSERADFMLLFCTQTIASYRANEELLDRLRCVFPGKRDILLVVDEYEKQAMPSADMLAERLGARPACTLPTSRIGRLNVVNSGRTFFERLPGDPYTCSIRQLVNSIDRGEVGGGSWSSFAGRLKSLVGLISG